MPTSYIVSVHAGEISQYTAYDGKSEKTAQAILDAIRNTLVLTSGTADIWVFRNGLRHMEVNVVNGSFTSTDY